ncbi:MAG: DUF421 domain-containing protein [Firmicutes bacterium]|nr:DUF421 domain-containing protein [Bacillota bacterium]
MKLLAEIIIQTFLAFFTILFITRLLGRQQVAQLTFFEYINGITFGSIAATLATDINQKTYQHFIGLLLFGVLTGFVSYLSLKRRSFSKVIEGEPILVIQNGKILEKNLKRTRYSIDELNLLLRDKDIFSPEDVDYALLEINGKVSVMKKTAKRNVTIEDLGLNGGTQSLPTEIVIGGQVIYENLRKRKLSGKDLIDLLKPFGINRINEVSYATIDKNSKIYVDKYEDNLPSNIDLSENNN